MKILAIIPARFASTRFPGKPLADIAGKTMLERVYKQATKAETLQQIVIATDDQRIYDHAATFCPNVMMTSSTHETGTDRCAEAYNKLKDEFDIVLNIQGDEPFIKPEQIDRLIKFFKNKFESYDVVTLYKKIERESSLFDPNTIKLVSDNNDKALYFSRSPIPYIRSLPQKEWLLKTIHKKHIGLYAYKANQLISLSKLKQSSLELAESLEQLRWIENGYTVGVIETTLESQSIDSPEDLNKVLKTMKKEWGKNH